MKSFCVKRCKGTKKMRKNVVPLQQANENWMEKTSSKPKKGFKGSL